MHQLIIIVYLHCSCDIDRVVLDAVGKSAGGGVHFQDLILCFCLGPIFRD